MHFQNLPDRPISWLIFLLAASFRFLSLGLLVLVGRRFDVVQFRAPTDCYNKLLIHLRNRAAPTSALMSPGDLNADRLPGTKILLELDFFNLALFSEFAAQLSQIHSTGENLHLCTDFVCKCVAKKCPRVQSKHSFKIGQGIRHFIRCDAAA